MNVKVEEWGGHEIRFAMVEGEWWAVAKDVAAALGYDLTTNMTRLLDDDEKGMHKVNTLGGKQDMVIITEFGIYEAVMNSQKQEAKEFKKWVKQILKNLRESARLEGYQAFQMLDKGVQKELMSAFQPKEKKDYMVINKMANAIVSKRFGYAKALKKGEMNQEMLVERQKVLQALIGIANMTGSKAEANRIVKELMA